MDSISREKRADVMSRIRNRDTRPEMALRRLVHGMGYRFRLHARDLPGRPDLVLPRHRAVIFMHGCFWHRHPGCPLARMPKSRLDFWRPKLEGNRKRDLANLEKLEGLGWRALVVWECELSDMDAVRGKVRAFLEEETHGHEGG
jgi:DNA mismatch endonuclease (patch repair protein)